MNILIIVMISLFTIMLFVPSVIKTNSSTLEEEIESDYFERVLKPKYDTEVEKVMSKYMGEIWYNIKTYRKNGTFSIPISYELNNYLVMFNDYQEKKFLELIKQYFATSTYPPVKNIKYGNNGKGPFTKFIIYL